MTADKSSNPDWTRDELIIALDVYLKHRKTIPGKNSAEIADLSNTLRHMGPLLFPNRKLGRTFRNNNGVYMKLMNFRRHDPAYRATGRAGLSRGSKSEEAIWREFSGDPKQCSETAEAIKSFAKDDGTLERNLFEDNDILDEAAEGRILTRTHKLRERNRKLVKAKRKQAIQQFGKLECEVCGFDFKARYGEHGDGFIECHHIKPLSTLSLNQKTRIDELALVCSNCHRMIHRTKPWLTLKQLKSIINS